MSRRFAGRVAFLTGVTSGIGRATALAFAREGAAVAVADVAVDGARETAGAIEAAGGQALAVRNDVTNAEDVEAAIDAAVQRFGRLDLAFNNAGIEQPVKPAAEIGVDEWDRLVAVNLRGVFLCTKREIEVMAQAGGGAIVNTSSGAGVKGFAGQAAYAATKHGIIGLTRSAGLDYAAQGIRLNAICPGILDTEMMRRFTGGTDKGRVAVIGQEPIGRMGRPEEIAAAVLWLCSDEAAFAAAAITSRTAGRASNDALAIGGCAAMLAGTAWMSRVSVDTGYLLGIAVPMIVFGVGQGLGLSSLTTAGMAGVQPRDAAVAGGLVNVAHQLGGALGLGVLVIVFDAAGSRGDGPQALLAGRVSAALTVACLFLVLALAVDMATRTRARAAAPVLNGSLVRGALRSQSARHDDRAAA